MTFEMQKTTLNGYPMLYGEDVVKIINRVVGERTFCNRELREIGEAVSPDVIHTMHTKTNDEYTWFGRLEYRSGYGNVAILFPWHQDWNHPESKMDRSINVYSERELPKEIIINLLEGIAYQIALYCTPTKKNPIRDLQSLVRIRRLPKEELQPRRLSI